MNDEDDKTYEGIDESRYSWWRRQPDVTILDDLLNDQESVPVDMTQKLNALYEKCQKEAEQSLWETLFGK